MEGKEEGHWRERVLMFGGGGIEGLKGIEGGGVVGKGRRYYFLYRGHWRRAGLPLLLIKVKWSQCMLFGFIAIYCNVTIIKSVHTKMLCWWLNVWCSTLCMHRKIYKFTCFHDVILMILLSRTHNLHTLQ